MLRTDLPVYHTPAATLERRSEDLMVVRFKADAKLTARVIAENLEVRKQLSTIPYAVISVLPEEGDFDMSVFAQDHYAGIDPHEIMQVEAVVAQNRVLRSMIHLFFAHYPQRRRVRVFDKLEDAMVWTEQQLEQRPVEAGLN